MAPKVKTLCGLVLTEECAVLVDFKHSDQEPERDKVDISIYKLCPVTVSSVILLLIIKTPITFTLHFVPLMSPFPKMTSS